MRGSRSSFRKNVQNCWRPLTWTSSQTSLNFLKDLSASFSFCRSARETYDNHFVNLAKAENCNSNRARPLPLTSYTRPFRPSEAILVPWVLKYQSLKVKATCLKWQLGPTKDSNFIRARPAIKQGDKTYYKGLPVHQGLANLADFEKGGSLDIIPGRK